MLRFLNASCTMKAIRARAMALFFFQAEDGILDVAVTGVDVCSSDLVVDGGRVKIMDFGIAKLANLDSQLTKTGMTLGTASYLAPEQIRGEDVTHAADIFSYGVLAYELFAHRRPFEGQSLSNLFYQILSAEPPPLDSMATGCPPELAAIVQRCLDKDPAKRWKDCGELAAALEPLRDVMAKAHEAERDRKSTRLNSSHGYISYAVFCLKQKNTRDRSGAPDQRTRRAQTP